MKYLSKFYQKISVVRQEKKLAIEDVAQIANVDVTVVQAWEQLKPDCRSYPSLDNLIDLCLSLDLSLDSFLDVEPDKEELQLELPGIRFIEEGDLAKSLDALQLEIEKFIPTDEEVELLRRFRRSDAENRKLIIQLMS